MFFVGQRKATLWSVGVAITEADEEAVKAYLTPRMRHLALLWEPLATSPAS
jgi:hypothetical protein